MFLRRLLATSPAASDASRMVVAAAEALSSALAAKLENVVDVHDDQSVAMPWEGERSRRGKDGDAHENPSSINNNRVAMAAAAVRRTRFAQATAVLPPNSALAALFLRAADHEPSLVELDLSNDQEILRWPPERIRAGLELLVGRWAAGR